MKKLIGLLTITLTLGACGLIGGGDEGGDPAKPPKSRGVFHPGPYTDPATGKTCNAPGGFCENDKACHSSAEKCPLK